MIWNSFAHGNLQNNLEKVQTCKNGCQTVSKAHNEGISDDIIFEFVVRGQGDEASSSHREGEENLYSRSLPDFDVWQSW